MMPLFYEAMLAPFQPAAFARGPFAIPASAPAPKPAPVYGTSGGPVMAAQEAGLAMLDLWNEMSRATAQFWTGPANPMMMAPRAAWSAGTLAIDAMAPRSRSADASWYRQSFGTQDAASGAAGFVANQLGPMLPMIMAQTFAGLAFAPFMTAPLATAPWLRPWAGAERSALPFAPAAPVAPAKTIAMLPAYQSDSGHAVAAILHEGPRVLMQLLPVLVMLVALLALVLQPGTFTIA